MSAGVTIDLGDAFDPPLEVPASRRRRWWLGAVVAASALAITTAAAPAAPPVLVQTRIDTETGVVQVWDVVGDLLYVVGQGLPLATGGHTLAAYRLPDGHRLWRVPLPAVTSVSGFHVGHGVVLALGETEDVPQTIALDAEDGRLLWRRPYPFLGITPSGASLLLGRSLDESVPQVIESVAVRTGSTRWAFNIPAEALYQEIYEAGAPARAVIIESSGRVRVRDLESARVILEGRLARRPQPEPGDGYVIGDLLFVAAGGEPAIAYDLATLEPRWTMQPNLEATAVVECGQLLCLTDAALGLRALDPDTGRVRWTARERNSVEWWSAFEVVGGRLFGRTRDTGAVIDQRTGRLLLDLNPWQMVWPDDTGSTRLPVLQRDPAGRPWTWLGVVDVVALKVHTLGHVPDSVEDCRAGRGLVACRQPTGTISVWRYPD